jgi:tetratricopeptide (TPR) repeat protein
LVDVVCAISEAYLREVRLDDAIRLLSSDVLELIQKELTPQDQVRIHLQHARILRHKCRLDNKGYDAALAILFEAEKIAGRLNDQRALADVVDLIGQTIYLKELWGSTLETPLEYFNQGLALRQEINDERGIAESLLHIGWVYQHRTDADDDDRQKAFELFQQAYSLAEKGDHKLIKAEAARHMADMYRRRGEPDKTLSYHMEFVTISEEIGFKIYLPPGYVMVGISHLVKGELDKALEYCEKARALAEEIGAQQTLAESLFGIGAVKEAENDTDTALRYYRKALATAQAVNFRLVVDLATEKIQRLSS